MIVICDPQCTGASHEKINSGFIYGLRLAYPQDKILFFADETHITGIKNILRHDGVSVDNIEYLPIKLYDSYSIRGILANHKLLKELFTKALSAGTNKIIFLSSTPVLIYLMKQLKKQARFRSIKCTIVFHVEFENIAFGEFREPPVAVFPAEPLKPEIESANTAERIHRIKSLGIKGIIRKQTGIIKDRIDRIKIKTGNGKSIYSGIQNKYSELFKRYFYIKKILLWRHSNDFHYVVLSPHVLPNAAKYIDVKRLNIFGIVMPIVFAKPLHQPPNDHVKFAVFGYGDSAMLYKTNLLLSNKNITAPYEIRVISIDNRKTEGFPNTHSVSPGRVLLRSEMEKSAEDIDIFLILYDKSRYQLCCSGSILEAISYTKPILHLSNDSVNYFNKPENPIGFCCDNLEDFADKMVDIINNYSSYKGVLKSYRKNILYLRDEISIEKLVPQIKSSFTFD